MFSWLTGSGKLKQRRLFDVHRVRVSVETVRRCLRDQDLVWRRPRPVLGKQDPQRAGKLDGDQNVVVVERECGTVYEGDEAGKSSAAAKNAKPARAAAKDGQLFEDHEAA